MHVNAGEDRSFVRRLADATARAMHAFDTQPTESEQFLGRLLRHLPGMAYRCRNDPLWTMEFVSGGSRELTGFDPADLVANKVVAYGTLIHPDDRERVQGAVQEAIERRSRFEITYRIRKVDGSERWVWEQGSAVLTAVGDVEAIEGFITDITDREELLARVADQESQFRALVDQALTGIYIVQGGRFVYVNARFAEILGYSAEEVIALRSVMDVVHPDDQAMVRENLRLRLESGLDDIRYECRALQREGAERVVDVHGRRIEFRGKPAVLGALQDVTDRRRAQRRYHEAQKMEALGRLATGVAHDLNNFLAVIKTTAELLKVERPGDDALSSDLGEIVDAVERGVKLGRQLMRFGNQGPAGDATSSVSGVVEGLLPILRRLLGSDVRIAVDIDPLLANVRMEPTHFEEIVTNLVVNAGQAMPEGGMVELAARICRGDVDAIHPVRKETHVEVEVNDDGVGIAPPIQRRVFEPYFTTKEAEGNGLGLANVWRLVSDAGGLVELDSVVGRGSTFRIFLPAADA